MKIILGVFVLFTLFFAIKGWEVVVETNKSSFWPTVSGELITLHETSYNTNHRNVHDNISPSTIVTYVFEYEYKVDGVMFKGNRLRHGDVASADRTKEVIDKYSKIKYLDVHYNPSDPRLSVIETNYKISSFIGLMVGFLFLVLSAFFYFKIVRKSK